MSGPAFSPASGWVTSFHIQCMVRLGKAIHILLLLGLVLNTSAQGNSDYVVLQTGTGSPLVSTQQAVSIIGVVAPAVAFDFGFYTEEVPTPDTFLDSFTVTIQDSLAATAIIVTADGSAVVWSPPTPGTIALPGSSILFISIPPPNVDPILAQAFGFNVTVLLPSEYTGPMITLYFDLFDNQNSLKSLGWFSRPRVLAVPEPGCLQLLPLGLLVLTFRRRVRA